MITTLAFLVGAFAVSTLALGLFAWYQRQQIAVLEDICAGMANGQVKAVPMDEWGE